MFVCVWDFFLIFNAFYRALLAFCFQVSKTQLFLLRLFVGFVDFKYKFCCEFWIWIFLNQLQWITSCFEGLNQLHSILSCIFRVFSVITNRNLYGLIVAHVIGRYLTFQFKSKKKTCIQKVSWLVDYEKTKYQLQKDTKSFIVCVSKIYSKRTNSGTRSSSLYCLLTDSSLVIAPRLRTHSPRLDSMLEPMGFVLKLAVLYT